MAEKLRESGWRKENYRMYGFLVHQTTGHAFNQGPFMDGAVMKQKDRGCLGRRWCQCVARGGINFGKPTGRAHKVPPSSDGFCPSHHGKKHLQKFSCRIWGNYQVWRWAREGSFPPCEIPNFALRREKWLLKHPSLTSVQVFSYLEKGAVSGGAEEHRASLIHREIKEGMLPLR